MTNTNKYPDYIMRNVRQRFGLQPDDTSKDTQIVRQSERQIIEDYFAWIGIIGYGNEMINVISDVYKVDLGNKHEG